MKMNISQPLEYKRIKQFRNQLVIIAIVLTTLTIAGYSITRAMRTQEHEFKTMTIGTVTEPCSYEVSITYKDNPIDYQIISPSGTVFTEKKQTTGETTIVTSDTGDKILIYITTCEKGDWLLKYNHRYHNTNLKINASQTDYAGLAPMDTTAVLKGNELTFSFVPYTGNGTEKIDIHYYILGYAGSSNAGLSFHTTDKPDNELIVKTNTKVEDTYIVTDVFKNAAYKQLRLICYQTNCNKDDPYYCNVMINQIEILEDESAANNGVLTDETEEIQNASN